MTRFIFAAVASVVLLSSCASNDFSKEIPIHTLSIGMSKQDVVSKLGNPHRVVSSEVVNGVSRQAWMYRQDKVVWLSGNAFLGGQMRNDQVTYLLGFEDERLVGWRDNDYKKTPRE
jgi:hypothetical protein